MRNETLLSPGHPNLRSVYVLLVFFVVRQVMMLILKTVFHPNGELCQEDNFLPIF